MAQALEFEKLLPGGGCLGRVNRVIKTFVTTLSIKSILHPLGELKHLSMITILRVFVVWLQNWNYIGIL